MPSDMHLCLTTSGWCYPRRSYDGGISPLARHGGLAERGPIRCTRLNHRARRINRARLIHSDPLPGAACLFLQRIISAHTLGCRLPSSYLPIQDGWSCLFVLCITNGSYRFSNRPYRGQRPPTALSGVVGNEKSVVDGGSGPPCNSTTTRNPSSFSHQLKR